MPRVASKNKILRDAMKPGSYTSLGFRAAEYTRSSGQKIGPMNSGADVHVIPDRDTLVAQSQTLFRDNGIYQGIIKRIIDNVLGSGLTLVAKTSNPETNSKLEALWKAYWHKRPETRNMKDGRQIERLIISGLLVDGDYGAIKTNIQKIQLVESQLIYTPVLSNGPNQIIQGIEINKLGAPVAYYKCGYDRYGYRRNNPIRVDAADFVFIANQERISQTRGIPFLVASFPNLHRVNDIQDSEAVAWQLLSKLAIAVYKDGADKISTQISEDDPQRASTGPQDISIRIQEVEDGTIFHGNPGDKIAGIDRNIPGPNFTASMTMYLRLLGLPVGIPLELLLLDWSRTNYSSARAALEQFFVMIIGLQAFIKYFVSEINLWKIQEWIDAGELTVSDDIFEHDWILPSSPWIDQLKESQAQGEQIDRGLTTHAEALKSLNRTREQFLIDRKREIIEALTIAQEINKQFPDANVPWEIFAGFKMPGTMAAVAAMDTPDKDVPDAKDSEAPDEKDAQPADAKDVKGGK